MEHAGCTLATIIIWAFKRILHHFGGCFDSLVLFVVPHDSFDRRKIKIKSTKHSPKEPGEIIIYVVFMWEGQPSCNISDRRGLFKRPNLMFTICFSKINNCVKVVNTVERRLLAGWIRLKGYFCLANKSVQIKKTNKTICCSHLLKVSWTFV